MPHDGMHEQSPISRENCSILSDHDLKEAAIIGAGFVNRIESQKAKVARKLSQMTVGNKSIEARCLQPQRSRKNIRRGREAIHVEPRRIFHMPAKIDITGVSPFREETTIRSTSGCGTPHASMTSLTEVFSRKFRKMGTSRRNRGDRKKLLRLP